MTDEIMPREDRSGKMWAFLGGCIAGIAGLFAVALVSGATKSADMLSDSLETDGHAPDELLRMPVRGGSINSET